MVFGHGAEIETVLAPVYDGDKLPPGATLNGPAVIEEITTSIVIEPGWAATLDASGVYVLEDKVAGAMAAGTVVRQSHAVAA